MKKSLKEWERIEYEDTPIYFRPDVPDWFVPNQSADHSLIRKIRNGQSSQNIDNLLRRMDGMSSSFYTSRTDHLSINKLKECWIHITNFCNMECKHCMFKSSPHDRDELTLAECNSIINESFHLGCKLFFFTGGEPFTSDAFYSSIERILALPQTHIVVLTNLSLLSRTKDKCTSIARDRLHFQVSIDGLQHNHDALRGSGAYHHLRKNLNILHELGFAVTLSMTVTKQNVEEMDAIIDFAAQQEISNVHFLWLFKKGNADDSLFVDPDRIFHYLKSAQLKAEKVGVRIDNIEIIESQVFSCPGTRYDLSNASWESIAIGPDGSIYPTPALIYTKAMRCGHISEGIENVWRNSNVLKSIREASLNKSETYRKNALRFIVGGGDIDHSFINSGQITGGDPYVELYNNIAKWLIVREANKHQRDGYPAFRLKMGEKLGDCPVEGSTIFFTHSNCVLSLPGHDNRSQVDLFYSNAAEDVKDDILNPICYDEEMIRHIPEEMRYRSYGCGSPVLEAHIQEGETVVDLGSGTGIECFIASKLTGQHGNVIGIDMGETMLSKANNTKQKVVEALHYDNIEFKKAFLENLPVADLSTDLVISNCVLNLSPHKRQVFQEIFRILKPGGRMVISDITYNDDVPLDIKYNEKLRGECIGGALRYHDLFGLLNDIGFSDSEIMKGYHYRTVKGYDFFSITYQAFKRSSDEQIVLFDFPVFEDVMAAVESEPTCACFTAPERQLKSPQSIEDPKRSGCMVCGAEIKYLETNQSQKCHYCEQVKSANAICSNDHFVCDDCHRADAIDIIKQICFHSQETDAVDLMQSIRSHPHFRINGPEHHSLVPAVILTALRNNGYTITDEQILTSIQRGQTIAGGACAFLGACGAALGVGIAFSLILAANPLHGDNRQIVQQVTREVLGIIAGYNAPRCCQRDSWLALHSASRLLKKRLGMNIILSRSFTCEQFTLNKECIDSGCPLWPRSD